MSLPPITQSNISTQWSTNFFTVILTTNEPCDTYYTVDGSNPISSPTRVLYNEPFTIDEEGIHTVQFYSISHATSLQNLVQTHYVRIDNSPPVTTITASISPDGTNGWYVTLPTITLSAADNVSGIDKTMYSWDGATFQEYTGGNLIIPDEGIHYLQVYSLDLASNKEEVQTRVFKYDISAPTTSIRIPLEVSYNPVTIEFVPTDGASGYETTYYTIDGTTPTLESDSGPTFDISESGLYIVKYFSVDNAGNVESIKESGQVRVEIDPETIQVLLTESFPINGKNGWYRASPQIGILTTKPHLVTSLEYKVAPKEKPTTATYTSTVEITGEIDLSDGTFIALELDQSGQPLVINIRGTDKTKTTIDDIIGKINDTIGGDTPIAKETGPDGLEGTGYVTVTSPTAGTGSQTSEIKFVSPGTYDATGVVFGLDVDNYPHTFTETYLFEDYSAPFLLPGNGYWNVVARATTATETAEVTKDYRVDSTAPVTTVNVVPDPNPEGFYTTSPDITFSTEDEDSGIDRIVYQFDNGPVFEYHPEDGPLQLPPESKEILLRYFSVDIAGNSEAPKITTFNYDFIAPTTKFDINAVNLDSQNILDIMFCPAQIVKYNPYTDEYQFTLTPQQRESLSYFAGWTNDLDSRLYDETTPVAFNVDVSTDILTFIPAYTLLTEDVVRVASTGVLPTPLQPATDYYIISVTDTECKLAATLSDAQNSIAIDITDEGTGIHTLIPDKPTIVVFDPLKVYLWPIDDREYVIEDETVATKDEDIRELTIENGFLKHVISIYNQATLSFMSYRYFSDDKIYTVESFSNTDTIIVSYAYTKIKETHYTINGSTPTTLSPEGHIIHLFESGEYDLKWFSIDEAGNQESIVTFPATIVIINRAPTVDVSIVKHNDVGTLYSPNGTNNWYKRDEIEPLLRPVIKIEYSSPNVSIFNENSDVENVTGAGPYNVELRVLKVDATVEEVSDVTRVRNITKAETYSIVSYGGVGTEDRIFTTAIVSPDPGDVFEVDYKFNTVLDGNPDGKILKIGDPNNPDVEIDFSAETSLYYYQLPSGYNIQGAKEITIVVKDLREAVTTVNEIPQLPDNLLKLDVDDPITVDNVVPGWVATDVTVTLTATDPIPPLPYEFPSGMYRIYYSTDGSFPNVLYGAGSVVHITLTTTGQYVIKYRGIDNAGNDESVKTSTVVQIDKIAPTTTISVVPPDGYNGWYKTPPSIVLNAVDLDSGVDKTYYKWDDDPTFTEYIASILIPSEGVHTLYYYSVDNVGNVEVLKQQEFKLDTIAPVTTDDITGSWTNDSVIHLTVLDDSSGPYRTYYTYALVGDPHPDPTLFSPYTETFEIAIPASGIYNVKYFSIDNAGNQEAVQTALNQFYLDLTKPVIVSIDPPDLVFTTQTYLTVNFTDTFSGLDIDTVRIVVDDIEYSTSKNSSFFSYSGTPFATQVQVGPVASIPNFDKLESAVIYANDFAGNALDPEVIQVIPVDNEPPYIRRFWPRDKANDVSRDTNIVFEINDDISTVDIRTVKVKVAETEYQLVTKDVIDIEYSGLGNQIFIDVRNHSLFITVDGIVIININLTHEDYITCKKVATFIDGLPGFSTTIDRENDQILSTDLIGLYHVRIDPTITLSVATFEDNVNINYMPRDRGYLIAITPTETFDDNYTVITRIEASDFTGNEMPVEQYSFVCKDITTPSRDIRYRWYDYHVDIINRIKSNLESTYNKYTDSTVFHGYFRSLALEIARAMQIAEDYRDDVYYDGGTTRSELLYQNIGYLLKTPPQEEYTHNEYRQILMAVMYMLFHGSTKQSLLTGLGVFLGIHDLSITENSLTESSDISQQFSFTFDVSIGDNHIRNWEDFNENIDAVLRIVKPAHTYFLIRYLFSEIVRTKDIVDEIIKWHFEYYGTEDVRTDCAEKYKVAETITEDVSNQFSGSNNCCTAFYTPILSWDETTITTTPSDIQVTASGGPINVISVDGFTGEICFDRNPGPAEIVEIIYKFNKYVIYRKIGFYLNTYTLTGGGFDPAQPYLLNQTGNPVIVMIAYDNPEEMHAHICEAGLFIDVHYPISEKLWTSPVERIIFDVVESKEEVVNFDVKSQLTSLITNLIEEPFGTIRESVSIALTFSEQAEFIVSEHGEAEETNPNPFETNDPNSLLNTSSDMLFFLIKRVFGDI